MLDITVGGVVIPGVVATLVSAWFNYRRERELRRLESRLRVSEEAFRIAQSPRVASAIALWKAFRDFEGAVGAAARGGRYFKIPKGLTPEEREKWQQEQETKDREAELERIDRAHEALWAAHAEAECLIPKDLLDPFDDLLGEVRAVHSAVWEVVNLPITTKPSRAERIQQHQEAWIAKRPRVVEAMRKVLGADAPVR